jgi:hypothetical protein
VSGKPQRHFEDVGDPASVVKLVQDGTVPPDASFDFNDETREIWITWFGYPKTDDGPARHYDAIKDR